MADKEAAKQLILKILAVAGGRLGGTSRLNKAFYAAHLIYWQEREGILTDYPVVKMPNGPGIDQFDQLLAELEEAGAIQLVPTKKGPYTQTNIVLSAAIEVDPTAPEYEPIRRAVIWAKTHTTPQLSRITHSKPSYDAQPRMGHEQAIYLDAVSEDEYERMRMACAAVDEAFRAALGA